MDAREVIIRPIVSEKSYRAIDTNRYSFEVNYRATKPHIQAAVEEIFKVKVIGVHTMNVKPKQAQGCPQRHDQAVEEGSGRARPGQPDRVFRRGIAEAKE
jgi:ribosomal protein L23